MELIHIEYNDFSRNHIFLYSLINLDSTFIAEIILFRDFHFWGETSFYMREKNHISTISKPDASVCRLMYLLLLLVWKFLTPALADGFSQEFEGQQVSSSLKDFTQYSGWS